MDLPIVRVDTVSPDTGLEGSIPNDCKEGSLASPDVTRPPTVLVVIREPALGGVYGVVEGFGADGVSPAVGWLRSNAAGFRNRSNPVEIRPVTSAAVSLVLYDR